MEHIVKRKGHKEKYDERKVFASVYASCLALRMSDEEAELIANMVSHDTTTEFKKIHEVDAHTIHKFVVAELKKYSKDVAFIYDTHKDIS